jgi:hypothetical protein
MFDWEDLHQVYRNHRIYSWPCLQHNLKILLDLDVGPTDGSAAPARGQVLLVFDTLLRRPAPLC